MSYGYEKILRVQKTCGVSFEEADRALRRSKGDESAARLYIMRRSKRSDSIIGHPDSSFMNLLTYRMKIFRGDRTYVDLSMGILLLISFLLLLATSTTSRFIIGPIIGIVIVLFLIMIIGGVSLHIDPKPIKEEPMELIKAQPMDEDMVLENYSEEDVIEEEDGNTIEIG